MRVVEFGEAASFLSSSSRLLLANEGENNLLFSSSFALAKASATRSPRLSFFIVEDRGETVCAALNSIDRRILLSTSNSEAAFFLGQELALRNERMRCVLGPADASEAFCHGYDAVIASISGQRLVAGGLLEHSNAFSHRGFSTVHDVRPQIVYRLEHLDAPPASSGWARLAKEKDLRLLIKWSRDFIRECDLEESPEESDEVVRRYLEAKQILIWEDEKPVAMAGFGGQTPNGIRVSMVYTDPKYRGHGFAGNLVFGLSRRMLLAGRKYCYLYADANDPAANRVYHRLGYRPIGRFSEHRFASAASKSK